jgi:hypothetical protein
MILRLEGHRDLPKATVEDVARAVYALARPNGPTWVIVNNGGESYAQAAGTDGRYVIESRTLYGEAFQHFRVFHHRSGADNPAVVYYRQRCKNHQPRRCPLNVRESEVSRLIDVERALLAFVATGERTDELLWRDVTQELVEDARQQHDDDDGEIGLIAPW